MSSNTVELLILGVQAMKSEDRGRSRQTFTRVTFAHTMLGVVCSFTEV